MATVQASLGEMRVGENILVVQLTTIVPGASLDITIPTSLHKANVAYVAAEVVIPATSQDPAFVWHVAASDSPSAHTARVVVDTVAGGDLTGMTLNLMLFFREAASGGLVAA